MKRGLLMLSLILALPLSAPLAAAEELTPADFVDLTIARLELADVTWRDEERAPTDEEEDALFADLNTTEEGYYEYWGNHRQEVENYLAENPDLQELIDELSQRIEQHIERAEV